MESNVLLVALQAAFSSAVDAAIQAQLAPLQERIAALEVKLTEADLFTKTTTVELTESHLEKIVQGIDLCALAGAIDLSDLAGEISASDVADNFSASDIAEEIDIEGAVESFFSTHRLRVC